MYFCIGSFSGDFYVYVGNFVYVSLLRMYEKRSCIGVRWKWCMRCVSFGIDVRILVNVEGIEV